MVTEEQFVESSSQLGDCLNRVSQEVAEQIVHFIDHVPLLLCLVHHPSDQLLTAQVFGLVDAA